MCIHGAPPSGGVIEPQGPIAADRSPWYVPPAFAKGESIAGRGHRYLSKFHRASPPSPTSFTLWERTRRSAGIFHAPLSCGLYGISDAHSCEQARLVLFRYTRVPPRHSGVVDSAGSSLGFMCSEHTKRAVRGWPYKGDCDRESSVAAGHARLADGCCLHLRMPAYPLRFIYARVPNQSWKAGPISAPVTSPSRQPDEAGRTVTIQPCP